MIDKVSKYTSFLGLLFFIGAVWFEIVYYSSFDIDIFTFISFSDIISLFISTIPALIAIALFVLIFIFFLSEIFKGYIKKLTPNPRFTEDRKKEINSRISILSMWIFIVYMVLVFFPVTGLFGKLPFSEGYFIMKIFAHFIFLFWMVIGFLASKTNIEKAKLYKILFVIVFFGSVYYYATHSLWLIRNRPNDRPQIQLLLNDSTEYKTTDTLIFIGKTNNHIFLYNTSPTDTISYSTIIKMDEVKSYKIFKHVNWLRIP